MPISNAAKNEAGLLIAAIPGLEANPTFVVEDVNELAQVWETQEEFLAAINSTKRAIEQLIDGSVDAAELTYSLEGWQAYHFQHKRGQGLSADMRIVFRMEGGRLRMLAFGHRSLPNSVYYTAAGRL
ncbi:MAG: hypothetical protein IJ131_06045 [Eggerthellaceae bacterium]|nr:hypothetical protein [Eggerthellaceae bacterium]